MDHFMSLSRGNTFFGDFFVLSNFANTIVKEDDTIVELGTHLGLGAMILSSGAKVYTVDRYSNFDAETVTKYLALWGVVAIKNDTAREAQNWLSESVSLLFIDGGHEYETLKEDYFKWYSKVKSGGHILFHDMDGYHKDVWDFYNKDLAEEKSLGRVEEIDISSFTYGNHTSIKAFRKVVK